MKLKNVVKSVGIFRPKQPPTPHIEEPQPVEDVWRLSQYFNAGVEFPNLSAIGDRQLDGLWVCHCGHENQLVHLTGAHPFQYLKCGRCEHILCKSCPTSEILTPITSVATEASTSRLQKSTHLAYCSVCLHCGLSHRATMSGGCLVFSVSQCTCGHPVEDSTFGYYIGSVQEYRRDPEGTAVALSRQRHHAATLAYMARLETTEPVPQRAATDFVPRGVAARGVKEPIALPPPRPPPQKPLPKIPRSRQPEMIQIRSSPLVQTILSRPPTQPRAVTTFNTCKPVKVCGGSNLAPQDLLNGEFTWYEV
jgi:hypothetical protein